MFHFPLRLFYLIFIFTLTTTLSLADDVSFGETCSDQFSCVAPLICSTNTSRCQCSQPSSIWNEKENDCFYCLPGWIQWHDRSCLSLSVPPESGLIYEQAIETCQLLHLSSQVDFDQFQMAIEKLFDSSFSSAVTLFFRLGAWIDHIVPRNDFWCDNPNGTIDSFSCIIIRAKNFSDRSLCLERIDCNEEKVFVCNAQALSERRTLLGDHFSDAEGRLAGLVSALAPTALSLVGNLLGGLGGGGNSQTQPQPQPSGPQQIIIQHEPSPQVSLPQTAPADNTWLYVILIGGGIFMVLLVVCGMGGLVFIVACFSRSFSRGRSYTGRSSLESAYSY